MLKDCITAYEKEMFSDLAQFIAIPSVSEFCDSETAPYGENVKKALDLAAEKARAWGFEAKNLGRCTEIRYGTGKGAKIYIVGHLDVVPEGDGWETPPYEMTEKDGCIYGRGVLDDKGPSVAVLYALKALKDEGIVTNADLRVILGGEEEKGMSDLIWYVSQYGAPDFGLTPDSSFPIINAELGIVHGTFRFENVARSGKTKLVSLHGGRAFNCVPDRCEAELECEDKETFFATLGALDREVKNLLTPAIDTYGFRIKIKCAGVAAHGSVPHKGRSAVVDMTNALAKVLSATNSEDAYLNFVNSYYNETNGKSLGIYCRDDLSGDISVNGGIADYDNAKASITVDSRIPVSVDAKSICDKLCDTAKKNGGIFDPLKLEQGFCVPEQSEYIQAVAKSYEKVFGEKARCLCERGGTYAKAFVGRGVAFGPIDESDPSQGGNLHTTGEYIRKDALVKLAYLYAETIAAICR